MWNCSFIARSTAMKTLFFLFCWNWSENVLWCKELAPYWNIRSLTEDLKCSKTLYCLYCPGFQNPLVDALESSELDAVWFSGIVLEDQVRTKSAYASETFLLSYESYLLPDQTAKISDFSSNIWENQRKSFKWRECAIFSHIGNTK